MNRLLFLLLVFSFPLVAQAGALDNINVFFIGVNKFFTEIMDFLKEGIYDLVKDTLVLWTKYSIKAFLIGMLYAMDIAYTVAQEFMQELGIVDAIADAFSSLDSATYQMAQFFKIPEMIEIVISAYGTKFALNFVPIYGGR